MLVRRLFCFSFFGFVLLASPLLLGAEEEKSVLEGDLQLPDDYFAKKKIVQERNQIIPMKASEATSTSTFGSTILDYHLKPLLNNAKIAPLEGMKKLEKVVNNSEVDTKHFKIKSKIDVQRLKAEIDIDAFVKTRLWTENSFQTLRAQMKLYEGNNNLVSIENKSDHVDTRTYFNLERTW